jgi:hypothetical protein
MNKEQKVTEAVVKQVAARINVTERHAAIIVREAYDHPDIQAMFSKARRQLGATLVELLATASIVVGLLTVAANQIPVIRENITGVANALCVQQTIVADMIIADDALTGERAEQERAEWITACAPIEWNREEINLINETVQHLNGE